MTPAEIYQLIAPDLIRVEEELRGYTKSDIAPITEIGDYLLDGGGKRVRPALLLLTARMIGDTSRTMIRLAAVIEFIHNATLVHDDVIDEANTRRGRPSANSQWGNPMTVLAGDWLYMQSFAVALGERNFDVLHTLIDVTQKMVEGELLQLTLIGRSQVTESELLDVVERKTAYLFSGCTRLPAIAAGLNHGSAERLTEAGKCLGMAFQLVDDTLDLISDERTLGKPVANDLKEGKLTLPVLLALRNAPPEELARVQKVMDDRSFVTVQPDEIVDMVRRFDGLSQTQERAREYARRATDCIAGFPPSIYRDALMSIAEFVVNRNA